MEQVRWEPRELDLGPGPQFGSRAPAIQARIRELAHEVTDTVIEEQKPGNRGLMLNSIKEILAQCEDGDPDDPRWAELKLRALDRMAKLLRLYEPQAAEDKPQGDLDRERLMQGALASLDEMEAKLRTGGRS
jgi:hypothetical protein